MADIGLLNGIETEFADCSVNFAAGTDGATASFTFFAGLHLKPVKNDKIQVSLDGLSFTGIVDDVTTSYEGPAKKYTVSAQGPQQLTDGSCTNAADGTIQEIADRLTNASGLNVTVVGDTEGATYSFPFTGTLKDALDNLQSATGFFCWIAPSGTVYLINRSGGFVTHPLPWTPGNSGYKLQACKYLPGLPKTVFRCHGKNPKETIGGPDAETPAPTYQEAGDGSKLEFTYDETWTEITKVTKTGTQVSFAEDGSPAAATAACVHYPARHMVKFATAPADGDEVKIFGVKQFSSAEEVDEAMRDLLVSRFGGSGLHPVEESHPELVSQQQAEQYANGLKTRFGGIKQEATAEVWAQVEIYTPLYQVPVNDGDGFTGLFPVQSNSCRRDGGKWIQSVVIGNGREGGQGSNTNAAFNHLANRIRRATQPPQPTAPTTTVPHSGSGQPLLNGPTCIAFDPAGNLYFSDAGNARIRKITDGILSTYAGNGTEGYSGDGGPAADATIYGHFLLTDMQADTTHLYFCGLNDGGADTSLWHTAIRRIEFASGNIELFAGSYVAGDSGDGGAATSAELDYPRGLALAGPDVFVSTASASFDPNGNIRKISGGIITRIVDDFSFLTGCLYDGADIVGSDYFGAKLVKYAPDGSGPTEICSGLLYPAGIAYDPESGDYFTLNSNLENYTYKIVRVTSGGTVTHFAGADTAGYSGDGGPAVDAQFRFAGAPPMGLVVREGFLYVADTQNHCIRKIDLTSGIVTLVAGTPETYGFDGDGGPAM